MRLRTLDRTSPPNGGSGPSNPRRTSKLSLCFLTYEFPRSLDQAVVSGEVKNPYHLVRGLVAAGHRITVVSVPFLTRSVRHVSARGGPENPAIFDVPEGGARLLARYAWRIWNVQRFLTQHLSTARYDLIHAQSPALALAAMRALKARGLARSLPVVTTAHGTYLPEVEGDRVSITFRERMRVANARLLRPIDQRAFAASSAVICVSNFQQMEMLDTYAVDARRLAMIYNGIDRMLYRPDGIRWSAGMADDLVAAPPTILFAGRLVPKKGVQHLIEAAPLVIEHVPNARFLVVGGSPAFDTFGHALRAEAAMKGVADRFTWLQDVPESDLPSVYRSASVAVFPSINYESLPTVVLEAMACGVPVVATDAWGTPEALGSRHPGLVPEADPVELAQRIVTFVKDSGLAEYARRLQAERVVTFDLARTVAHHEALYAALL